LGLLKIQGQPEAEIQIVRQSIDQLGRQDAVNWQIAGVFSYSLFSDTAEAIYWLEKRGMAPPPTPPMDLQGKIILARAYAEAGRWEDYRRLRPELENLR